MASEMFYLTQPLYTSHPCAHVPANNERHYFYNIYDTQMAGNTLVCLSSIMCSFCAYVNIEFRDKYPINEQY